MLTSIRLATTLARAAQANKLAVRTASTLVTASSHPQACTCARCAPRTSTISSLPTPRALSHLAQQPHPRSCGCARCAPRTSTVSTIVEPPARPISSVATTTTSTRPELDLAATKNKHGLHAHTHTRGMKVRSSIKKYCEGCSIVKRQGTLFVLCSRDPKHKQLVGSVLSCISAGLVLSLAATYFTRFNSDAKWVKSVVSDLTLLAIAGSSFDVSCGLVIATAQHFYLFRCWITSGRSNVVVVLIASAVSLASFAVSTYLTIVASKNRRIVASDDVRKVGVSSCFFPTEARVVWKSSDPIVSH
ncbi:hypothetical protein JCM3766R1_002201 [Sporobolomyces carnicolor]